MKTPKKPTEKTTSETWLQMDLKAQSGAIWEKEDSKLQKKKARLIAKLEKLQIRKKEVIEATIVSKNLEKMSKLYEPYDPPSMILSPDPVYYGKHKIQEKIQIIR